MPDFQGLRDRLRFAKALYDDGVDERNLKVCRDAAQHSLRALVEFLESDGESKTEGLALPIENLAANLQMLDQDRHSPMLAPSTPNSRPSNSKLTQYIQGLASGVMEIRMAVGKRKRQAAAEVAASLNTGGYRLPTGRNDAGRLVKASTVINWRDMVIGRGEGSGDMKRGYELIRRCAAESDLCAEAFADKALSELSIFARKKNLENGPLK
jgi:hypothetical protein